MDSQLPVTLAAFDASGAQWRRLWMDVSGGHKLQVTVSGQPVQVSGQTVRITDSVGQLFSLQAIGDEQASLLLGVAAHAFDGSGIVWRRLWMDVSGGHRVLVSVSGQPTFIGASGQTATEFVGADADNNAFVNRLYVDALLGAFVVVPSKKSMTSWQMAN